MESPPDRLRLRGFDALYGLQVDAFGDGLVRAHVPVRDEIRQPFGLVHGGVLATIAESLASLGTLHGSPADHVPLGMSNHTTFLRPIADGAPSDRLRELILEAYAEYESTAGAVPVRAPDQAATSR